MINIPTTEIFALNLDYEFKLDYIEYQYIINT